MQCKDNDETATGMLGVAAHNNRTRRRRKLRSCLKKPQLESEQQTCSSCSAPPCSTISLDTDLTSSSTICNCQVATDDSKLRRRSSSRSEENRSSSWSSLDNKPKKVSFNLLHIAIFPIQLGDNPAVSAGVPIQLSWKAEYELECELDMYENSRPVERRTLKQLSLSVPTRARIALQAGHSLTEIALATLEVDNIKTSRYKSMQDNHFINTSTHHMMNNSTKQHQQQQQSKWMRAISSAASIPSATASWNNHFAILRERTTRALRTLTQSQPRTAWAKTA